MSKNAKGTKRLGFANLDLSDFLNSRMNLFNSSIKLLRCEDKKALLAYQLKFEMRDESSELMTSQRSVEDLDLKYASVTKGRQEEAAVP